MSSNGAPSVTARGVGKAYTLAHRASRPTTAREAVVARLLHPFRGRGPDQSETFWALRDVGFDVHPGEVVGVIGRNGAGKSTLLKILSRITAPTTGAIDIRGRMVSLLEVGTGFHPELTGRENVFLNGAILGMTRREVARRFDEIVAFAEVERFLDTPVKRYSSGMYVRLAFAVASHLEAEILVVDEVVSVGDASFQKRCLHKMQDVSGQGRAVLFVSHSMNTVTRLCTRALLLDGGKVVCDGPTHEVTAQYLRSDLGSTAARDWPDPRQAPGNEVVRLRSARVVDESRRVTEVADIRRPVGVEIRYEVLQPGRVLTPNYSFFNGDGTYLFHALDPDPGLRTAPHAVGTYTSTAWLPGNFLAEGTVVVGVAVTTLSPETVHLHERDAVAFRVVDTLEGDSARGDYAGEYPGVIRPLLRWETRPELPAAVTAGGPA